MNTPPASASQQPFLRATQQTALVYAPFLEAARFEAMVTTLRRREGSGPEHKGTKDRSSSVVMLALVIDTLLRFVARKGLPHHRPALIWKMLGISRQMFSVARRWLAEHGVTRGEGSFGEWSVNVPMLKTEIGTTFIPIPEAALYVKPFDFLVLAMLHECAEKSLPPECDKRKKIIPLARYVPDAEEYLRIWLGVKAVRASMRRLAARSLITIDDGVKLTPVQAAEHMFGLRLGEDIWTLMKAGKRPTVGTFAALRGEELPDDTVGDDANASSSFAGEGEAPPPVPGSSSKPPSSQSSSTSKPLYSASVPYANPKWEQGHGA